MRIGPTSDGQPRDIACDESGYEGEKLVGGETDVFAHAGVHLTIASAAGCVEELRRRIRSPALEYKANHLLREKHRPVLEWLLSPQAQIHGHAHVHLVDKTFLLVSTIVELLVEETPDRRADTLARTLYREGRQAPAHECWAAFLVSSNDLLRARNPHGVRAGIDSFHHAVDDLRAGSPAGVGDLAGLLVADRSRNESRLAQRLGNPRAVQALDPLVPAIVGAVAHWSGDGSVPVSIVHDRQTTLTEERIARITEMVGGPRPATVRLVDSRSDPRVQVADFLAGVARKAASDELAERGDAELVTLVAPYVSPSSIWGDDRSWSLLGPVLPKA